jgi:hypothetical protein
LVGGRVSSFVAGSSWAFWLGLLSVGRGGWALLKISQILWDGLVLGVVFLRVCRINMSHRWLVLGIGCVRSSRPRPQR